MPKLDLDAANKNIATTPMPQNSELNLKFNSMNWDLRGLGRDSVGLAELGQRDLIAFFVVGDLIHE